LAVFLQLSDELVTLLNNIRILLVLVVGTVGLDDALDTVNGARDTVCGNELGKIPGSS
jgi:hypothetical protein